MLYRVTAVCERGLVHTAIMNDKELEACADDVITARPLSGMPPPAGGVGRFETVAPDPLS